MRMPARSIMAIVSLCAALSGCAGIVDKQVSEENKDPTFQYDGLYSAIVNHPGGIQYIQQWQMNCGAQEFEFEFAVKESVIDMGISKPGTQQTGFVGTDGQFRVPIPTDKAIKASGTSDVTMDQGQVTLILQGELKGDKPFGYFVYGVKQFNNRGCSYRMNFTKIK